MTAPPHLPPHTASDPAPPSEAPPAAPAEQAAAGGGPSPVPSGWGHLLPLPLRLDDATSAVCERLQSLPGQRERAAVLLALLMTPGSARERQAWVEELQDLPTAEALLEQVEHLPAAIRLPLLERLLGLAAEDPLASRDALLRSMRRVMTADGRIRPIDRLAWLLVRRRLLGLPPPHRGGARDTNQLTGLPLAMRQALASVTAYLARLVPQADLGAKVGAAGAAWYRQVVGQLWGSAPNPPSCRPPDADELGRALHTLEELAWMRRPLLARIWVEAALPVWAAQQDAQERLAAAEALRMVCHLLDTPLPPALARLFVEPPLQRSAKAQPAAPVDWRV
ncbi:MAG: hypothetical protein KA896_08960 [Leptothrix sp. (in: Bacteria)]|nr:hypothetical protein [Leptothrix sp. (in: b-proteobacteria)]